MNGNRSMQKNTTGALKWHNKFNKYKKGQTMCSKRYKAIVQKVHISAQRYKKQLKENAQSRAENRHKKEK